MRKFNLIFCISALLITGCLNNKNNSASYVHEIECMGTELDGSVTLKSWGKGKDRQDALEQARKESINEILFKGIRNGKDMCDTRPIFNNPNVRANNSDYFNQFFKDGGNYKKYVSNADESEGKRERAKGRDGEVMFGFIVRVLKNDLKKQMIADGLLSN